MSQKQTKRQRWTILVKLVNIIIARGSDGSVVYSIVANFYCERDNS